MSIASPIPQVIIQNIGPGGVGVLPDLMSQRDPKAVRALVKAVRHHGATLRPITVRERGGMLGYDLIDGLTELQAARVLKLDAIRAIVQRHQDLHNFMDDAGYRKRLADKKRLAIEHAAHAAATPSVEKRCRENGMLSTVKVVRWFKRRHPELARNINDGIELRSRKARALWLKAQAS